MRKKDRLDLLITALEGGSNYWYTIPKTSVDIARAYRMFSKQKINIIEALLKAAYRGEEIVVHDVENPEDELGIFSKANMVKGEKLMREDYPEQWANIRVGNWDGETADIWFQLTVLGEVAFG